MPRPALLVACLLLAPSAAHAQLDTGERFDGEGHRVLVEVGGAERREGPFDGVFPRDFVPLDDGFVPFEPTSFAGATFAVYARARALTQGVPGAGIDDGGATTLDVELAWRGVAPDTGIFRMGNPLLSAALGWATRNLVVRVALGAGLPLTSAYERQIHESRAYAMLRASQGHGDVWLATEESFPLVLRARVEGRADWFFAGGDLAGALMPTLPRSGNRRFTSPSADDLLAIAQLGAWLGVRPVEALAIGGRGQLVVQEGALELAEVGYGYPPLGGGGSGGGSGLYYVDRGPWFRPNQVEAFVSLIAFIRAEIDDLTLEGRLYLNLDTPDGVAFDQGATWSATLTAGWTP